MDLSGSIWQWLDLILSLLSGIELSSSLGNDQDYFLINYFVNKYMKNNDILCKSPKWIGSSPF
ncbi:conserved protein of unknown function [Pseudomonas marincola]|uniref:Uncharacterized protein n=1 Tax=Pseudomonas marincola TaxID=437900 RepID=A0A653E309_9PSED|nr:conserved protein of unknown function [Pseudomonas marincola]